MNLTTTRFRALAMALSVAISTALLSAIVGNMPPDFQLTPNDASNGVRDTERTEVAIVPSRIDVVGVRSEVTAATEVRAARPRS